MFQKLLVNKHYSVRDLKSRQKLAERRSASGHRQNEKKQEPPRGRNRALKITVTHSPTPCNAKY